MSAEPLYPRADAAARNVDPMLLASALDHIAKSAAKSRSQTRRIRWIKARAEIALRGEEYRDIDLDLPYSAGPNTPDKLARRLAYHIALRHSVAEVLKSLHERLIQCRELPVSAAEAYDSFYEGAVLEVLERVAAANEQAKAAGA